MPVRAFRYSEHGTSWCVHTSSERDLVPFSSATVAQARPARQTLTINRVQLCVLVDKEKSQPRSGHQGSAYCVFNALYDTAVGKCMDAMGSENRVQCVVLYACM